MKLSLVTLLRRYVGCSKSQNDLQDWCDDDLMRLHKKSKGVYDGIPERVDIGLVLKHVSVKG